MLLFFPLTQPHQTKSNLGTETEAIIQKTIRFSVPCFWSKIFYTYINTHTHTHTHTHIYIYIYIYTYTHTQTYIYIYLCILITTCYGRITDSGVEIKHTFFFTYFIYAPIHIIFSNNYIFIAIFIVWIFKKTLVWFSLSLNIYIYIYIEY